MCSPSAAGGRRLIVVSHLFGPPRSKEHSVLDVEYGDLYSASQRYRPCSQWHSRVYVDSAKAGVAKEMATTVAARM